MAKRFENLETYVPWACEFILKADAHDVFGKHTRVLCELENALDDKLINWSEFTLAQHLFNTVYALRKETLQK